MLYSLHAPILACFATARCYVCCIIRPFPPSISLAAAISFTARLGLAGAQRMTIARYRINANRGLTGAGHLAMHMPDIPETVNDSDSNSERGSITLPVKPLSAVKGEGETKVMDFDEALFQGRGTPDIGGDQGTPMKPPVLFSFTSPAYAVLESAGFINIPVRRSGNLDSQVRLGTFDVGSGPFGRSLRCVRHLCAMKPMTAPPWLERTMSILAAY